MRAVMEMCIICNDCANFQTSDVMPPFPALAAMCVSAVHDAALGSDKGLHTVL